LLLKKQTNYQHLFGNINALIEPPMKPLFITLISNMLACLPVLTQKTEETTTEGGA